MQSIIINNFFIFYVYINFHINATKFGNNIIYLLCIYEYKVYI